MNNINAWDFPYMIGWDSFFPKLENMAKVNATGFPPYNVRKINDDKFVIELAVAGYSKNNLTITETDGNLTIAGELPEASDEYLYKGIAGRKFTRTFSLAEHVSTTGSHLVDGMLLISLEREIPEEKKPRAITIEEPLVNERRKPIQEYKDKHKSKHDHYDQIRYEK
jgi:molecular chaperone IbpA